MLLPDQPTAEFPYQINRMIGNGAMGEVYEAIEPALGRKVAIKVLRRDVLGTLPPTQAQEMQQRFLQEARAAAALSNPNITTIYRVGAHEQTPYIAMEWLDGRSLRDIIDAEAPLPLERAVACVLDILDGLQDAHEAGIVHRDIKPANLMVLRNGRVKITDFGVAHVSNSQLVSTQQSAVLGTPLYASPEQLQGMPIDARTDLYAVGVVFFELLTGQVPFDGNSLVELLHRILKSSVPSIAQHNPGVPPEIEQYLVYALAKTREDRFESAAHMAEVLGQLIAQMSMSPLHLTMNSTNMRRTLGSTPTSSMTALPVLPPHFEVSNGARAHIVAEVVTGWPNRLMGVQHTRELMTRLLERPLHAAPFSGAACLGSTILLIHNGLVHAAFDRVSGLTGDRAYEALGAQEDAVLFPRPEHLPEHTISWLASMTHPPQRLHENLDSSFVNLGQLLKKLQNEGFQGVVALEHGGEQAFLALRGEENLFNIFAGTWSTEQTLRPWHGWVDQLPLIAHVEVQQMELPAFAYRQELHDAIFTVQLDRASKPPQFIITPSFMHQNTLHSTMTMQHIYQSDPMFRFLGWFVSGLPQFMSERKKFQTWKYLTTWIKRVHKVTMHHELPRPETGLTDFFDMVTESEDGQVLHIVHHVSQANLDVFNAFVDRVIEAKTARIKTGDVGGAVLIAEEFTPEALEAYKERIKKPETRSLLHAIQESFTGYEGFVRIGSRRGFHLLLVREDEHGYTPLLPET